MSDNNINKVEAHHGITGSSASQGAPAPSQKGGAGKGQIDPLLLAYMEIFQSVQLGHDTAQIQAKGIAANAQQQEKMINLEAGIQFVTLRWSQMFSKVYWLSSGGGGGVKFVTKKISQSVLQQMQSSNQEISAVRGVIENQLTVTRQNAQVCETNLNSVVNEDQQSVQQGGSLMQMLVSLTNQVSRI